MTKQYPDLYQHNTIDYSGIQQDETNCHCHHFCASYILKSYMHAAGNTAAGQHIHLNNSDSSAAERYKSANHRQLQECRSGVSGA